MKLTWIVCFAAIVLSACGDNSKNSSQTFATGDPHRGKSALERYGCVACHTIPGIRGPNALIAPPLIGISQRSYLAGTLENTPENLRLWIQHPHKVNPHTAMPEQGVTDRDASDIAAYLYSTR